MSAVFLSMSSVASRSAPARCSASTTSRCPWYAASLIAGSEARCLLGPTSIGTVLPSGSAPSASKRLRSASRPSCAAETMVFLAASILFRMTSREMSLFFIGANPAPFSRIGVEQLQSV